MAYKDQGGLREGGWMVEKSPKILPSMEKATMSMQLTLSHAKENYKCLSIWLENRFQAEKQHPPPQTFMSFVFCKTQ